MAGQFGRCFEGGAKTGGRVSGGRRPFLLTLGITLLVYGRTLAPDLTWANWGFDGGELTAAAATLGVPHPSGYPTYTLLAKVFSLLPIGTLPGRLNLLSAVCAGLAAALMTLSVRKTFAVNEGTAVTAGLMAAFTPLVWGQAVITEVYALNLLAVALVVWSLAEGRPAGQTGLLLGLSITTHLTSVLLLPLVLRRTPWREWGKLGLGTAVGLTPYLLLPLMAGPEKAVVWGEPNTLSGWWWLVSGQIYQPNLALPLTEIPTRLWQLTKLLGAQFTPMGWLILFWGLFDTKKQNRKVKIEKNVRFPFLVSGTILLYLLIPLTYQTNDAPVNLLPGLYLSAFLMAPGLQKAGRLAWVLPLVLLLLHFPAMDLHDDWQVRTQTERLLAHTPPHAILLTPGDATITAVWALHFGEGQRPDLIPVDANLFAFDWYRERLKQQQPDLAGLAQDDLPLFEKLNEEVRPFCHAAINTESFYLECNKDT